MAHFFKNLTLLLDPAKRICYMLGRIRRFHMERLRTMGASWFVSYLYFKKLAPNHRAWAQAGEQRARQNAFRNSRDSHIDFLRHVIGSNPNQLNKNSIGLPGVKVIAMAEELLRNMR